jgi:hypothetical protein
MHPSDALTSIYIMLQYSIIYLIYNNTLINSPFVYAQYRHSIVLC